MIIKLEQFEGPLSLLLRMIEEEKLDIVEVSLAKVADQYIDYIKSCPQISPENIADFLLVACKLLLIKSKALLPYLSMEEEKEIEEFEEQLRMYQEFLSAVKNIRELANKGDKMFARKFDKKNLRLENSFFPPRSLSKEDLKTAFQEILSRLKPAEVLEKSVLLEQIKIEDKISHIRKLLSEKIKLVFSKLVSVESSKTEVVVSFLAILELAKQGEILLSQTEIFGEIDLQSP